MEKIKKICHFNGKRGGFGALKRTLRMIKNDPDLELQLIIGDMHLKDEFGKTMDEVEKDFETCAYVDTEQKGDTPADRSEAIGVALYKITRVLENLKPDVFLCIGDRGEVLASVIAAVNLKIPVFHVEGGDISGNLDESFRHAITKMANIHLTTNKESAERIKKMGEEDWRIHIVGDVHIDPIMNKDYYSNNEMRGKYSLGSKDYAIIMQHSVTTEPEKSYEQMSAILKAIDKAGIMSLAVYPCSDQGYEGIIKAISEYQNNPRFKIFKNIPAPEFLGLLEGAKFIIGNSSCGIKESPYFRIPSINVGKRQTGRKRDALVIDVLNAEVDDIFEAINKALFDNEYRQKLSDCDMLYGDGKTAEKIVKIIKETEINEKLFEKRMTY